MRSAVETDMLDRGGKKLVCKNGEIHLTFRPFEIKTLRVEKVVPAGKKASIQIRPLESGRYRFFDEYHEDTTEGFLIVK